jgi:cardiolipin synthase A/B
MMRVKPSRPRLARAFRARRVHRAVRDLSGFADPGFRAMIRHIASRPFAEASGWKLFARGGEAFASMLADLEAARGDVLMESYIFRADATGLAFRDTLQKAARRGVSVRLLVDAFGCSETPRGFFAPLRASGAEVIRFHPWNWNLRRYLHRDHRKILVVDRRILFIGGMNIGEEYGSVGRTGVDWLDAHARVEGPIAREAADAFREAWNEAGGGDFEPGAASAVDCCENAALIVSSRPRSLSRSSSAALAAAIATARKHITIANAYFLPKPTLIRRLDDAVRRGVEVRLILPGRSDIPIVRRASRSLYGRLLRCGIRVFEYQAAILHAKLSTADGAWTMIGSTNLDLRSIVWNWEANLVSLDPALATLAETALERALEHSKEILRAEWRRRPFYDRWRDDAAALLAPIL